MAFDLTSYNREVQAPPSAARAHEGISVPAGPAFAVQCSVPCKPLLRLDRRVARPEDADHPMRLRARFFRDEELRHTTEPSSDAGCPRHPQCFVTWEKHQRNLRRIHCKEVGCLAQHHAVGGFP
jgi:hypothetical protein